MENFGSWSVLTTNFLIILYLSLNGITLSAILHLVNGKWRFQVRNLACSLAALQPLAFIMLVILLANGESTFQWLGHPQEGDHLPGWLNYNFLVAREIIGFFFMSAMYGLFIKYQHESEIDSSYAAQRRFRNLALMIPVFYVLYGTMVAWDFEMTMYPGWHSASYGFYHFQSNFHMFLAFFTIFLFVLQRSGKLVNPIPKHIFNYMAQFMLGMTILWTYLYFTQYLIMWYGRLPEDMTRYNNMMENLYAPLWWLFLSCKFIIPFVTFVIMPNRHNPNVIVAIACLIVFGTWVERYVWISGASDPQYYHIPMTSLFDIAVTAVVIAAAYFSVRWSLTRYRLVKSA